MLTKKKKLSTATNRARRVYQTIKIKVKQTVSLTYPVNIPFPTQVFPKVLRNYVREAASAIGCDPSYVALPLLAVIARVICNKRSIRLKGDWIEPAIIWGAVISESGEYKTPAQSAATTFLRRAQKLQPNSPDRVTYFSSDITFASLRDLLATQPDSSILSMPDELVEVFHSFGSRGQSATKKGHWLSMWSAKELAVHRYRQQTFISRAAASMFGGIQPDTFRDLVIKERHIQDGMCARFLLTWRPQTQPSKWTNKKVSVDTRWEISDVFERLLALPADFDGEFYAPQPIPLSVGAEREWIPFYQEHNEQGFKLDRDLKAAWKKLEAYAARIALIFQLVTWASRESSDPEAKRQKISRASMSRAIAITEWFKYETKRVYALLNESPEDVRRRELTDLIRRSNGSITVNELRQKSRKYNSEEKASKALQDLVKQGLAERVPAISTRVGGRPAIRYALIT